jgi:hypothetical protein
MSMHTQLAYLPMSQVCSHCKIAVCEGCARRATYVALCSEQNGKICSCTDTVTRIDGWATL